MACDRARHAVNLPDKFMAGEMCMWWVNHIPQNSKEGVLWFGRSQVRKNLRGGVFFWIGAFSLKLAGQNSGHVQGVISPSEHVPSPRGAAQREFERSPNNRVTQHLPPQLLPGDHPASCSARDSYPPVLLQRPPSLRA